MAIETGRFRRTTARCEHGHEWPALELFDEAGRALSGDDRVFPSHCPDCRGPYRTLID